MSLLKPTSKTPFHIDFDWWEANDRDWRVFLRSLLCAEHQEALAGLPDDSKIDWIDARTGEVKPVDGVQHALMSHCALQPDFVDEHTTLVEAVFRLMLVNGNQPMSPADLSKKLHRPADTILRTLAGTRVYRGLRPVSATQAPTAPQPVPAAENS
jgi:hypothetical protein